jgi:hypothetical protein
MKTQKFSKNDKIKLVSNLDWIFNNGKEVLRRPSGASIEALARSIGINNLWGSHGEGFIYIMNSLAVIDLARKFLENNDKSGWLLFAEKLKSKP